jgi:glycolate oxidase FAD binding subunit
VSAGRLQQFADEIGAVDPVTCVGGRTQWDVGGVAADDSRPVTAPSGLVAHEPAEMIARVRAGTVLSELQAQLRQQGQYVPLEADDPDRATIGGLIAVGRSGPRRLGWGPTRDSVLEVTSVSSRGELIRAGAPLVKNVTGFDLCRLLTGSLGTLAFVAEVVLRCQPVPECESWWRAEDVDPFHLASVLHRPLSILWDGRITWVALDGYRVDIDDQARSVLGPGFVEVEGPPRPPTARRLSLAPSRLKDLAGTGTWLAQVGVGIVHGGPDALTDVTVAGPLPRVVALNRSVKAAFDPTGRMNPGRDPLLAGAA